MKDLAAYLNGRSILVTGGTGSFGQGLVEHVLRRYAPKRLVVLSRDEMKQLDMRQRFSDSNGSPVRYFIGDVRDRERLYRAFDGIDIVIHAAALKQVPAAEYNPLEFVKTNVLGTANVVDAAIDCEVKWVLALSTDKAVSPINLYGATKLCADKLLVAANAYSGRHKTRFGIVRYGNVAGSRGSVIPRFMEQRREGTITITDLRMTRFWITVEQGVDFVLRSLARMRGGEIFIPKMPSVRVADVAEAIAPGCRQEITGIRPGEKLHEALITQDDARNALEFSDYYVIQPTLAYWTADSRLEGGQACPESFTYRSDENSRWLGLDELGAFVERLD